MAKKINPEKVKRSIKSSFDFSKFYFSKSTSVILITTYSTILFLSLATLGFSQLIDPVKSPSNIPTLPEKEPFAFLPADNLEVPALGEVEKAPADEPLETAEKLENAVAVPQPAIAEAPASAPVEIIKTVEKEVIKEVPKEVIKIVEKEVPVKTPETKPETTAETKPETKPIEPEQTYFDNYYAPEIVLPDDVPTYENFPDEEETAKK